MVFTLNNISIDVHSDTFDKYIFLESNENAKLVSIQIMMNVNLLLSLDASEFSNNYKTGCTKFLWAWTYIKELDY